MLKMVPLVLQILILNANSQVQEDVNGKLIEERCVDSCYTMSSAYILKQKPVFDLLPLKNLPAHGTWCWLLETEGMYTSFFNSA